MENNVSFMQLTCRRPLHIQLIILWFLITLIMFTEFLNKSLNFLSEKLGSAPFWVMMSKSHMLSNFDALK